MRIPTDRPGAAGPAEAAPSLAACIRQLLQVRRLYQTPLILIGPMWGELVEWARRYLLRPEFPLASPSDIDIPRCVDTAQEAIALIQRHHEEWVAERARAR
jgi:hypothetical protein